MLGKKSALTDNNYLQLMPAKKVIPSASTGACRNSPWAANLLSPATTPPFLPSSRTSCKVKSWEHTSRNVKQRHRMNSGFELLLDLTWLLIAEFHCGDYPRLFLLVCSQTTMAAAIRVSLYIYFTIVPALLASVIVGSTWKLDTSPWSHMIRVCCTD